MVWTFSSLLELLIMVNWLASNTKFLLFSLILFLNNIDIDWISIIHLQYLITGYTVLLKLFAITINLLLLLYIILQVSENLFVNDSILPI